MPVKRSLTGAYCRGHKLKVYRPAVLLDRAALAEYRDASYEANSFRTPSKEDLAYFDEVYYRTVRNADRHLGYGDCDAERPKGHHR